MNALSTLSPQEKKVLISLSSGSLYKEIAQDHHISVNTVKKHLKNVYRKLNVHKRGKAVEKLLEGGANIIQTNTTASETPPLNVPEAIE